MYFTCDSLLSIFWLSDHALEKQLKTKLQENRRISLVIFIVLLEPFLHYCFVHSRWTRISKWAIIPTTLYRTILPTILDKNSWDCTNIWPNTVFYSNILPSLPHPRSMLFFKRDNDLKGIQHCTWEGEGEQMKTIRAIYCHQHTQKCPSMQSLWPRRFPVN